MLKTKEQKTSEHTTTKILIDYFCFTVRLHDLLQGEIPDTSTSDKFFDFVAEQFFVPGLDFQQRRGMNGYTYAMHYDGVIIAFGGADTVYIQMSGTGCRTWESIHPGMSWEQWIDYLSTRYCSLHISRMDVACDTFGMLRLEWIKKYTHKKMYISRWKKRVIMDGTDEQEVVWGSAKSNFRLRIYDKTLERQNKGNIDPALVPENWVRCEFQMRNKTVESFLREWRANGSIGKTFLGILKNQLIFTNDYDGKNRDRATIVRWWAHLLDDAEQIKMSYAGGKDYNFDSLKEYVYGQAGSSIRTLLEIYDGDTAKLLAGVEGKKLNTKQQQLIADYKPESQALMKEMLSMSAAYKQMMQDVGWCNNGRLEASYARETVSN